MRLLCCATLTLLFGLVPTANAQTLLQIESQCEEYEIPPIDLVEGKKIVEDGIVDLSEYSESGSDTDSAKTFLNKAQYEGTDTEKDIWHSLLYLNQGLSQFPEADNSEAVLLWSVLQKAHKLQREICEQISGNTTIRIDIDAGNQVVSFQVNLDDIGKDNFTNSLTFQLEAYTELENTIGTFFANLQPSPLEDLDVQEALSSILSAEEDLVEIKTNLSAAKLQPDSYPEELFDVFDARIILIEAVLAEARDIYTNDPTKAAELTYLASDMMDLIEEDEEFIEISPVKDVPLIESLLTEVDETESSVPDEEVAAIPTPVLVTPNLEQTSRPDELSKTQQSGETNTNNEINDTSQVLSETIPGKTIQDVSTKSDIESLERSSEKEVNEKPSFFMQVFNFFFGWFLNTQS
ncbi:MAG: hypothetical protein ACI92I_000864 [Acidimicrobiales bacterium]|jgi:hypothetical protein